MKNPPLSNPRFREFVRAMVGVMAIAFLSACSQVNPTIIAVEELPAILLDDNSKSFSAKNLRSLDVVLTGSVSQFANRLQVSFDQGASWQDLSQAGAQSLSVNRAACSPLCPFSVSLTDVGQQWASLGGLSAGSTGFVLIRGTGLYGSTAPAQIQFTRLTGTYNAIAGVSGQGQGKARKVASTGKYQVVGSKVEIQMPVLIDAGTIRAQGVQQ